MANLLSDAALAQVRELIRQEQGRARGERTWHEPELTKGPEVFVAYLDSPIPARSGDTPGELEDVPLYKIDRDTPVLEELLLPNGTANTRTVYNIDLAEISADQYIIVKRTKFGTWLAPPVGSTGEIRRCCLAENHPGCGVVFNLKLGTWNPATDGWTYESTASAKGIDWWYSIAGPYPDAGATGNFIARPSDTYGTIWECVGNMSCDDDACGTCAEPT